MRNVRRLPMLVAIGVGLALLVAVGVLVRVSVGGSSGSDCAVRLEVNSSTEKGDLLAELAEEYNESGRELAGGGCARVTVSETSSGVAKDALAQGWEEQRDGAPEPQAWTPSSSLWLTLLQRDATAADRTLLTDEKPQSLATSPLAIAMPRPMAEALGWPEQPIGWRDVLSLTTKGWASVGRPEWGRFSLGKDNPHTSTSGLAATLATFYAATGRSSDLTLDEVEDAKTRRFVSGVEAGVLHYASDATAYMANLAEADADGQALSYASAIAVQEQLIHLYNQGSPTGETEPIGKGKKPQVPLVAVHPADGTLMFDHPFVVLPTASKEQRAAAADFRTFLLADAQQRRFQQTGFRDHEGNAGSELARSVSLSEQSERNLSLIDPPAPEVLEAILDSWDELRKKARVLLVMDVSGSMNQAAGGGQSRLEAAKKAAADTLGLYHPDDEVGLWAFSTETGDHPEPYRQIVPPGAIRDNEQRLTDAINGLNAEGGTALYSTVRAAQQAMLADLDTDRINAVVVLTDGRNEYPPDNDLDALLGDLDAGQLERSVRVFTVAFSDQADFGTLTKIAAATKATSYDARDPAVIDKVMVSVISNF
ncbi:substrate-binding and VWA domain-containing protein [Streptomyces sp. NBC_00564]|uniref:substrate-binding and vWA domain-containing protein n=1 Tax=Streptomyces sp. NBC_00564 TaxID=2903663 RepID=UPI002FCDBE34|nr:substrate-binding and VWA domain-containing protein [Streptomyces sp. NBC_00564]